MNRKLSSSFRLILVDSDKQSPNSKISEPELSKNEAEVKVNIFFFVYFSFLEVERSCLVVEKRREKVKFGLSWRYWFVSPKKLKR